VCHQVTNGANCTAVGSTPGRCGDGIDNDGDGRGDCLDPGCSGKGLCPSWSEPGCVYNHNLGAFAGTAPATGTFQLLDGNAAFPNNYALTRGSEDVSFLWQAPATGLWRIDVTNNVRIPSNLGTWDAFMGVYSTRTCTSVGRTPIDDDDDSAGNTAPRIEVTAAAGEWFTIVVTAFTDGHSADFRLNIAPVPGTTTNVCGDGVVAPGIDNDLTFYLPAGNYTASGSRGGTQGPSAAYIDNTQAWAVAGCSGQWLQLDMGAPVTAAGLITQGHGSSSFNEWVRQYQIQTSNDGSTFTALAGNPTFNGNVDRTNQVVNRFTATTARFWRILPVQCQTNAAMRVALLARYEECDDGNTADNDGCSATCGIERTATACMINSSVDANAATTNSTLWGRSPASGTAFTGTCPAGTVAVGLTARSDASRVYGISNRCAPLVASAAVNPAVTSGVAETGTFSGRTNTGTLATFDCPSGQFMIGASVGYNTTNSNTVGGMTRVQAICGSYAYSSSGTVLTRTQAGNVGAGPAGGTVTENFLCPGNTVVTGFSGNAATTNNGLFNFRVTCGPVTPVSPWYGTDSGTRFVGSCAAGQVALGMFGRSANSWVYRVGPLCGTVANAYRSDTTPPSYGLTRGRATSSNGASVVNGTETSTSGSGSPYSLACPAGQFMVGIAANVGGRVDFASARCAAYTHNGTSLVRGTITQTANTSTGGGGPVSYDCPGNGVVTGILTRQTSGSAHADAISVRCGQVSASCATDSYLTVVDWTGSAVVGPGAFQNTFQRSVSLTNCQTVLDTQADIVFGVAHAYSPDLQIQVAAVSQGLFRYVYDDVTVPNPATTSTTLLNGWGRGTWRLGIEDDANGDQGTLSEARMRVRCVNP
jgi:cysteine-rich repeat protein